VLICAPACLAVDLKQETVDEFNHYIAATETRLEPRWRGEHFLWFDESPELRQRLLNGTVVTQPAQGNGIIAIHSGLIQDQIGAVFVPHTSLKSTLTLVQDYDHHSEVYKPDVVAVKVQSRNGNDFQVHTRVVKAKFFLSDVLNIDNSIHFVTLDSKRVYSRSASQRVAEVSNPGKRNEHELPVGQDRGLMWRIYGYWFFEEANGGVFITCESITLTRDIPFVMAKLLSPVIHDLPAEALRTSLEQTRKAIVALADP
jgi:hypothetical protein